MSPPKIICCQLYSVLLYFYLFVTEKNHHKVVNILAKLYIFMTFSNLTKWIEKSRNNEIA